jgi:hypothetical protein
MLIRRMPWTFEQRIQRVCDALVDRNLLETSQIETLRRPLYFGQHAYGVGLALLINHWGDWFEFKDRLHQAVGDLNCTIQSNRRIYQFNVFSSDPAVLRRLGRMSFLTIHHVRIVDRSTWRLQLPRPRPKSKFYGQYGWRFKFKDPLWHTVDDNLAKLDMLGGGRRLVTVPRTFLYLDRLSDVLLFKLIAAEHLLSLDDRHDL